MLHKTILFTLPFTLSLAACDSPVSLDGSGADAALGADLDTPAYDGGSSGGSSGGIDGPGDFIDSDGVEPPPPDGPPVDGPSGLVDVWTDGENVHALVPAGDAVAPYGIVEYHFMANMEGEPVLNVMPLDEEGLVVRMMEVSGSEPAGAGQPDVITKIKWGADNCTVPPCPWEQDGTLEMDIQKMGDDYSLSGTYGADAFFFTKFGDGSTSSDGTMSTSTVNEMKMMHGVLEDIAPMLKIVSEVPDAQAIDWCKVGKFVGSVLITAGQAYCCGQVPFADCVLCQGVGDAAKDALEDIKC